MGQYFVAANLDKEEYLHPHKLDDGMKLLEIALSTNGVATALCLLLADNPSMVNDPDGIVGRWSGDRVILVGDDGVSKTPDGGELYGHVRETFTDVSDRVVNVIRAIEG